VQAWLNELIGDDPWLMLAAQCAIAVVAGLVITALLSAVMRRAARRIVMASCLVQFAHRPLQVLLPLFLVSMTVKGADVDSRLLSRIELWLGVAMIACVTWLLVRLVAAVGEAISRGNPTGGDDDLRSRSVQTQVRLLTRTVMFIIGMLGFGGVLMTFPNVRQIGASLLGSAGLAGIVAGFAARPILGNLLAGMQIALTQPIRLDDVVIVENEWGRIEEITGTYVVVHIWDDRRLVLPLEYFITNPFQNWTRHSSYLIGSVTLWVDFRLHVEPLRAKLKEICESSPLYDKRVCVLQVVDASDKAMQLRALVSAPDAPQAWDLRCYVREALIEHIQHTTPEYLPQARAIVEAPPLDRIEGSLRGRVASSPPDPLNGAADRSAPGP